MHITSADTNQLRYRERLTPSLWILVSAAVAAPMAALVFVPVDGTLALIVGLAVGAALLTTLIGVSPVIRIDDHELHVGRAHIAHEHLGAVETFTGDDARQVRGPGLQRTWWHRFRGGVDGVVVVSLTDVDDPHTAWAFSSRTPERIAAVLERAHA